MNNLIDKKLAEMHENNRTLESTFFEQQKGLSMVVKQSRFVFDECIANGFTEDQALKLVIGLFSGNGG
ncbi:hypothetical protein A5865_001159 [Enterococcus sp. 12E11_DIV0728]|nr:hypothetical protein A5865_001159 [Enterococcus sp. 12E11_DIV0728]OUZ16556.1 hypothetical protein A5868_001478 [Enterococcus sp. 12F9_DIV0723]